MRSRTRGGLVVAALLTVAASTSQAQQPQQDERAQAREHYSKGTKAFELGAFDEAIQEYAAAYRLRDDPALLYNLGQAHRLANHPVEAQRFYRLYLQKIPNAQNADEVREKIVELQKLIDQQKRTQSLPPDQVRPMTSSTTPAPSPPPSVEPPKPSTAPQPTPEPAPTASSPSPTTPSPVETTPAPRPAAAAASAHPGRTKIVAGLVVAGVGLGAVAGGIATGVLAKQAGDDLSHLDQMMQAFDASKESSGKTNALVSGVLLGVGAAAVVTGGVVFALGYRERARATNRARLEPNGYGLAAVSQQR